MLVRPSRSRHQALCRDRQLVEQVGVDAPHGATAALEVKDTAAVVHIEDDNGRDEGEDREDEEGRGHAVVPGFYRVL